MKEKKRNYAGYKDRWVGVSKGRGKDPLRGTSSMLRYSKGLVGVTMQGFHHVKFFFVLR